MSLLMQALKKAERAKQNSGQESELDKPSEAFDEILALAPADAPAPPPAPPYNTDALSGLSLAPLDAPPSSGLTPPATEPSQQTAGLQQLELSADGLPPIPVLNVATEAIHDPVPPQARHAATLETPAPAPASEPARAPAAPPPADAGTKADKADKGSPRGAARVRAAAAAPASDRPPMDPAKLRVAILGGIVVLIVLGYGYYFWQATSGPGAGSRLPMVPMPPPNATGATPALVVVAKGDAGVAPAPAAAPGAAPATAAPPPPSTDVLGSTAQRGPEDKARRELQTEREQMYNQLLNAMQSQLAQQRPPPGPDTLPPVVAPDSSDIHVARNSVVPQVDPSLAGGYQAYGSGDLAAAQKQYDSALQQDPNSRDALLGVAAVALRQHQDERAAASYARLLELNPGDPEALAGLLGLRHGDANQNELRLKNVLKQQPDSAPLLFALGNLYARQGRWPEAQQTYFRAYSAAPDNADYAFNLAIGLDRLNQPKLALTYYQRALALAQDHPASFDRDALHKRLQELGAPGQH